MPPCGPSSRLGCSSTAGSRSVASNCFIALPTVNRIRPLRARTCGRRMIPLGLRASEGASERRDDCRLRSPNVGNRLIILPPAPKTLVQLYELLSFGHLRLCILLLQIVELPLSVDDVEKIREPAIISLGRYLNGTLAP